MPSIGKKVLEALSASGSRRILRSSMRSQAVSHNADNQTSEHTEHITNEVPATNGGSSSIEEALVIVEQAPATVEGAPVVLGAVPVASDGSPAASEQTPSATEDNSEISEGAPDTPEEASASATIEENPASAEASPKGRFILKLKVKRLSEISDNIPSPEGGRVLQRKRRQTALDANQAIGNIAQLEAEMATQRSTTPSKRASDEEEKPEETRPRKTQRTATGKKTVTEQAATKTTTPKKGSQRKAGPKNATTKKATAKKEAPKKETAKKEAPQKSGPKKAASKNTGASKSTPKKATKADPKSVKTQGGGRTKKLAQPAPEDSEDKVVAVNDAEKPAKKVPDNRPEPFQQPPLWAQDRQALCETTPYFRSRQGGLYHKDEVMMGVYIPNGIENKTYVDEHVVIARLGGAHERDEETGEIVQVADQDTGKASARAYRRNMEEKIPLVVILGEANPDFPVKPPHKYNVLDYFKVTDMWSALNEGHKLIMVRLEKLRPTMSWWAPRVMVERFDVSTKTETKLCKACGQESKRIYNQGWACLDGECEEHFKFEATVDTESLTYDDRFLRERTDYPAEIEGAFPLVKPLPGAGAGTALTRHYEQVAWKGIACPKCKRCNCRIKWEHWECETEHCGFTYALPRPTLLPEDVFDAVRAQITGHPIDADKHERQLVKKSQFFTAGRYRVNEYEFAGLPGHYVRHYAAHAGACAAEGGADAVFREVQQSALGLKRLEKRQSKGVGKEVTMHFSVNYGMPYHFMAEVRNSAFKDAPPCVFKVLNTLNWARRQTAREASDSKSLNEMLVVGYMEGGKMGYHDDGEDGLGPTIVTMSLGCSAKMTLRMKTKYFQGITKTGKHCSEAPVLPGCLSPELRQAANEAENGDDKDAAVEQLRTAVRGAKRKTPPVLLDMKLSHGDLVVMHGAGLQDYYEHQVEPDDKLRFALTARYIDPSFVKAIELPKGEGLEEGLRKWPGPQWLEPEEEAPLGEAPPEEPHAAAPN